MKKVPHTKMAGAHPASAGMSSLYASLGNPAHQKPGGGHGDGRRIRRTKSRDEREKTHNAQEERKERRR
ncbi:MAG: hypothetical protein K2Y51_26070 [Gammaproteobacteria bacterium]|nr:hypothetical protein [Gammaproteobacteria bacterium]